MKKKAKPMSDLNTHIKELPHMQKLLHRRKVIHRYLRILFGVTIVILVIATILFLRDKRTQIYSITVSGNEIINSSDVIASVERSLSGNYMHLVPKTNIFFYPKNKVYENLKNEFPRFDSINVSLVNKTTLAIKVTEEQGTALWCGSDNIVPDMTSQCYFTDINGKIIDVAPYYSGNVYVRFFGGTLADDLVNPIGKSFIDAGSYEKLMSFAKQISGLGFQIQAVRITSGSDDFFVIDLDNTHTAFIQFKKDDNYDALYSNLQTALSKTELSNQVNANKKNLQYFDLRFTNKVYYKFNDGTVVSTASTTATSSLKKTR